MLPPFIGQLILWSLLTIGVGFFIIKSSIYRTLIGYAALLTTLCGFVNAVLQTVAALHFELVINIRPATNAFPIIYSTLAWIPGLLAMQRISKQKDSMVGICVANVGFFLAVVSIVCGSALYIYTGSRNALDNVNIYYLVNCGHCVFIIILGSYIKMEYSLLNGSLIAYTLLLTIAESIFLILFFCYSYALISRVFQLALSLFCVDLPMIVAIFISALCGHYWTLDSLLDDKEELNSTDNLLQA